MNDGKTQSKSSRSPCTSRIGLIEPVKYTLLLLLGHADTGILYLHAEVYAVFMLDRPYSDIDTAVSGKFDSVGDQMPEYLLDLGTVTAQNLGNMRINIKDQLDRIGLVRHRKIDYIVDDRCYHVIFTADSEFVHVDFGIIKDISDLLGNPVAAVLDKRYLVHDLRIEFLIHKDGRKTDNRVDGGSDLV